MKKKITAIALAALMAGTLAACTQPEITDQGSSASSADTGISSSSISEGPSIPESGIVVGGWEVNADDTAGFAPEEAQAAFDKATEAYDGQSFTIAAYVGSQVVAGTNHMFLCKGTLVTAEPVTDWKIVTVYADLEGNADIINVADFNIAELSGAPSSTKPGEQLAGGWTVYTEQPAIDLPEPPATAFAQAVEKVEGCTYYPLFYLGSQLVSGSNYAVLCRQTIDGSDSAGNLCVLYIYAPLDDNAEITNIYTINPADFAPA